MGIDFRYTVRSNASWSYSGFMQFRKTLASRIGIDIDQMQGFGGAISWDTVSSPIKALLDHSDCDGELSPEECGRIAPALRELVAQFEFCDYDKTNALALADTMDECAKQKRYLEFC